MDAGRVGLERLLDLPDPPSAVFAAGETLALGVLEEARSRQIDVPGDLAIIGYTDFPAATVVEPPLTMVSVPAREIGSKPCEPSLPSHGEKDPVPAAQSSTSSSSCATAAGRTSDLHVMLPVRGGLGVQVVARVVPAELFRPLRRGVKREDIGPRRQLVLCAVLDEDGRARSKKRKRPSQYPVYVLTFHATQRGRSSERCHARAHWPRRVCSDLSHPRYSGSSYRDDASSAAA